MRLGNLIAQILLLPALVALIGCAAQPTPMAPASVVPTLVPQTSAPTTFPMTITDDAGRQVTLKAAPQRIVSLAPSNTEAIYALGKGAFVVGVTEYCDYPPEAKEKPKIGGFTKIDLEKVVSLSPDLVLATSIHAKGVVPELEKRGITVVVVEPKNVQDVITKMATIGKLLGAPDMGAKLSALLKARVDAVVAKTSNVKSKVRVFYEIDKTLFTPGPGSYIDDMIVKAGGVNIAADTQNPYAQLSAEALIAKDPEVILLGDMLFGETPAQVRVRPGWASISAVKNGRIIPLPDESIVSRPGPRVAEGVESIARALYPDLFK